MRKSLYHSILFFIYFILLVIQIPKTRAEGVELTGTPDPEYTLHIQSTLVPQWHPDFRSDYQGPQSLHSTAEKAVSYSGTVFFGYRIFHETEVYVNPELITGGGISDAYGLGAYPNGEINRVGDSGFQLTIARAYVSQTFPLDGEKESTPDDLNQIAGSKATHYIRLTLGKYSLADFFDDNAYAHDQRTQFLNWCFMDNCAWDFAMNPLGYIYGFTAELNEKDWALRAVMTTEPTRVNGGAMDPHLNHANSIAIEFERHHKIAEHPGTVRLLVYENSSLAQNYADLVQGQSQNGYHTKWGGGINADQEITKDFGFFIRLGANDGKTESWTFTEADSTVALGFALNGRVWNRGSDTIGLGVGINGLTSEHAAFLKAGGLGLMLGDGDLDYAPEEYLEVYYSLEVPKVTNLFITPDFQMIRNPGYNQDRGPVPIYAMRLHYQWGL